MNARLVQTLLTLLFSLAAPIRAADSSSSSSWDEEQWDDAQLLQAGRIACATIEMKWASTFDLCVNDVVRMRDPGVAGMFNPVNAASQTKAALQLQQARIACAGVQEQHRAVVQKEAAAATAAEEEEKATSHDPQSYPDFEQCVQEIVQTGDVQAAKEHWLQNKVQRRLRGGRSQSA